MDKREKVFEGLSCCLGEEHQCDKNGCPYNDVETDFNAGNGPGCINALMRDALEVLATTFDDAKFVNMPRWISVKDKTPTTNGKYVVTGKGKVWISEWLDLFGIVAGWADGAGNPTIEAWMALE